ncbi:MAG: acylphosphatase [Caldisphaeraceae archaeon]|nr:acylphosphatase [Caldisphaeraceae archaeon]MEB3691869.1 acylphosphatase [Caldisphaeraceae archaeon]MEB3798135.1 acylphosphatase [Caldisphaeraceae archaeon]
MPLVRLHAFIEGIVQGVGYRYFARRNALRLGIKGYAKNLKDGRVEVVAEGEEEAINAFLEELKKGPMLSRVDRVEYRVENYKGEFTSFKIY